MIAADLYSPDLRKLDIQKIYIKNSISVVSVMKLGLYF